MTRTWHSNTLWSVSQRSKRYYTYVARSTIRRAGFGLFAAKLIPPGTIFDYYAGQKISRTEALEFAERGDCSHMVKLGNGFVIDARKVNWRTGKHLASFANSSNNEAEANAKFCYVDHLDSVKCLKSKVEIKKGDEIFCLLRKRLLHPR